MHSPITTILTPTDHAYGATTSRPVTRRPVTRRARATRRPRLVAVATALVLAVAAPAAAIEDFEAQPQPDPADPTVSVVLDAVCGDDAAGFVYGIDVQDPPPGNSSTVLQWRDAATGEPQGNQAGPNGFVASGEGDFEARGVLLLEGDPDDVAVGPTSYASDWTPVSVDCQPEDGPGEPDDPEIVVGTPTFTG